MKSIEQIKNEVAVKNGYADWLDLMTQYKLELKISYSRLNLYIDEVADKYAKQCCEEQIKACAESFDKDDSLDKCSMSAILNTPNVVTTNT